MKCFSPYSSLVVLLLAVFCTYVEALEIQAGKVQLNSTRNLTSCHRVKFQTPFRRQTDIRFVLSLGHGSTFVKVHDTGALWATEVTSRGFVLCVREAGRGSSGTAVIHWLALRGSHGDLDQGEVSFQVWSAGTRCQTVQPSIATQPPLIFTSVIGPNRDSYNSAVYVWVETVAKYSDFSICLREMTNFDGVHREIKVAWFSFDKNKNPWNLTSRVTFDPSAVPSLQTNYATCQIVNFTDAFYAPPVVLLTVSHHSQTKTSQSQKCNAVSTWTEEVTKTYFRVCMKDIQGDHTASHPVQASYIVIGDTDPCLGVSCDYFAVCHAFGPRDARCVCVTTCRSYEKPVCSSNGTTFRNKCLFQLEMCRLKSNHTLYHPGSCRGFPWQRGRTTIVAGSKEETACAVQAFVPFAFYPDLKVHVQLTVSHANTTNLDYVHEAMASWVENVHFQEFTACVTTAGRNNRARVAMASVDWFAYQGAPAGGVAARTSVQDWWTGTTCQSVQLPSGMFQSEPTVLVTAEHSSQAFRHDAVSLWLEDVTRTSFKACLRELQNFDGLHQQIHVNWLAFDDLHRPLFTEKGKAFFPNTGQPSLQYNGAFCKDLKYARSYSHVPTIVLSTNHASSSGSVSPACNGVSTWVEYMNATGFRICLKELYATKYEPLTVSYLLLSDICARGWRYNQGLCYRTSSRCLAWHAAENTCRTDGASLATVRTQEENIYIQQQLNGNKGWIGLNDKSVEGDFRWSSNRPVNWTFWSPNQPNNFNKNQDCVHTLGLEYGYRWNDVDCTLCFNYTCSKDFDECSSDRHSCHDDALCSNSYGSYSCRCKTGYSGNGRLCTDIDECSTISSPCHVNATCNNTVGSYVCTCKNGFSGDGATCTDIDECAGNTFTCDPNASCNNIQGSYTCTCNRGYVGNGKTCTVYQYRGLDISAILQGYGNTNYFQQLSSYLSPVLQSSSRSAWVRCWRAHTDGWSASTFHSGCDNKRPTVTIVRVGSYVFGGYSDISWDSSSGWATSYRAFLYTLYGPNGYSPRKLAAFQNYQYAIYRVSSYGPTFGRGHDLHIANYASSNTNSNTNRGYTYYNPGYYLAGTRNFTPNDVEVFYETT